jgi:protein-tyrosine-phosphatase
MSLSDRARRHAALGDDKRLAIVDHLLVSDRTVAELGALCELNGNLLAHHLAVLEDAGLIERHTSEGDRRRRYVTLETDSLREGEIPVMTLGDVVFVCTRNSARSQFAAALWTEATGSPAASAGSHPATCVNPKAIQVASEFGVDLSGRKTRGYDELSPQIDLVVSVCDRANETGLPDSAKHLHWSVPDPVAAGKLESFRYAFGDIERRVARLAKVVG